MTPGSKPNERSLRVEAVVLRHQDWGEADRLLVLFTRQAGKLRAVAKGARKLKSRKAGHVEPFTRVVLMLAKGRDLWIVTQAEAQDSYLPIRADLVKTGYASYAVELVDRFISEEDPHTQIFQLLVDTLQRISSETDAFTAVRYFEIRLLDWVGFRPQLFECVRCGDQIEAVDQFFSAEMGGVLCPKCGPAMAFTRPVSMQALKYLRHYQRSSYADAQRALVPEPTRQELEALMNFYLVFLLERNLNSPGFLKEIRNL
jgi:DNA repair protein RecO (recombination protein O)